MRAPRPRRIWDVLKALRNPLIAAAVLGVFVLWAHHGTRFPVFRAHVSTERGWEEFKASHRAKDFGDDGYFVRAAQNGYNIFFFTPKYASRFTRKTRTDQINACASCHTPEDMAYAFVNSDRFDSKLGHRVSFEERVMRCLAGPMDGFVPTLYDPTVRDLRIFSRMIAHHLQLSEGAQKGGD